MGSEMFAMPEPVAWLYTNRQYPDVQILDRKRWTGAEVAEFYIEQPLIPADQLRAAVLEALERARDVAFRKAAHVNSSWIANDIAEDIRQLADQVKKGVGNGV